MLHRFSWGIFAFIGALGVLMGARGVVEPRSMFGFLDAVGPSAAALAAPEQADLAAFLGRWVAIAMLGGNVLTVAIACTALRRGERWAAWAMLYWPCMFASHFAMYEPGPMRIVQVVWLAATTAALVVLLARPTAAARAAAAA